MMGTGGQLYYYQLNAHGDVIGLTNVDGVLVATYSYNAWGRVETTWENPTIADRNPFRYAGYIYDTKTGLYYLIARYYSPEWGRFVSPDTVPSVQNQYVYGGNNPATFVDPTGHFAWLVGAVAGGLA